MIPPTARAKCHHTGTWAICEHPECRALPVEPGASFRPTPRQGYGFEATSPNAQQSETTVGGSSVVGVAGQQGSAAAFDPAQSVKLSEPRPPGPDRLGGRSPFISGDVTVVAPPTKLEVTTGWIPLARLDSCTLPNGTKLEANPWLEPGKWVAYDVGAPATMKTQVSCDGETWVDLNGDFIEPNPYPYRRRVPAEPEPPKPARYPTPRVGQTWHDPEARATFTLQDTWHGFVESECDRLARAHKWTPVSCEHGRPWHVDSGYRGWLCLDCTKPSPRDALVEEVREIWGAELIVDTAVARIAARIREKGEAGSMISVDDPCDTIRWIAFEVEREFGPKGGGG